MFFRYGNRKKARDKAVEADSDGKYDYELRPMGIDQAFNMLVNRMNEMQKELDKISRLSDNFNQI